MPMIEISDSDFARMKRIAEPFVDTPKTIVSKLLDHFEARSTGTDVKPSKRSEHVEVYPFEAPPPLVHVKFISGVIGQNSPKTQSWDAMVALCLELCLEYRDDVEWISHQIDLNIVRGKKTDEGYKYLKEKDVSYQRVSAQHAASVIGKCSKLLGEGAYVDFIWRQKEDAYAPGKIAGLSSLG